MLFMAFACCKLLLLPVNAMEQKTYKTITNRDVIYVVEQDGSFSHSWQFDKQNYKDDIDFSLNLLNKSPYAKEIANKIDSNIKRQYLFFEHHGTLPTDASMKVKVSKEFKEGQELYLYYYNDATNKLEYMADHLTVKNGMVEFKIKHCSDYILTASIVRTAMDNPQSLGIVIIALIILGVILVAATLFINSKK
jgi:hypothetical protein